MVIHLYSAFHPSDQLETSCYTSHKAISLGLLLESFYILSRFTLIILNIHISFSFFFPVQADFFMTYILTSGLSGFSLEILQPGLLIWNTLKLHTWGRGKSRTNYLSSFPYHRVIPFVSLFVLVGVVYAVIAPLLLPFLVVYFLLGYVVYINQV